MKKIFIFTYDNKTGKEYATILHSSLDPPKSSYIYEYSEGNTFKQLIKDLLEYYKADEMILVRISSSIRKEIRLQSKVGEIKIGNHPIKTVTVIFGKNLLMTSEIKSLLNLIKA